MSREKKKKSKKSKYCGFVGKLATFADSVKPPKKMACPECKRKMEPSYRHCDCCEKGHGVYTLSFKHHKRKK